MQTIVLRRVLVSTVLTVLILFIGYYLKGMFASRPSPVRQMSFREQSKNVKVEPVVYKSREIALSSMGKVLSENAIDLMAEVQGEILRGQVPIKLGQRFSKGQILFKQDDEEAKLSLFAEKSNFMTAIANTLPDLKIDYPESYPTWQAYFDKLSVEAELPALPAIKNSQEKVFFSTRNIINQFYNIKSQEERLSKYVVRAPFSGSFVEVLQEENTVVSSGTRIARIAQSSRLEIEVPIRTEELKYIKKGMQVSVLAENGKASWKGRVKRMGAQVDPSTQSVNVYLSFYPGSQQVFEGQYLRVEIPGSRLKDVMEVPRNAIFNRNQIYVVNDSSRLDVAEIQIEKFNDETILFSGINAGSQVVVVPLVNAYPNMRVNIIGQEAPIDAKESMQVQPVSQPASISSSQANSASQQ